MRRTSLFSVAGKHQTKQQTQASPGSMGVSDSNSKAGHRGCMQAAELFLDIGEDLSGSRVVGVGM
jgi:hypothetical protein